MRMHFNNFKFMEVLTDELDLCSGCANKYRCPLISTLRNDLAVLRYENVRIDKCKLYTKKKRA
nr:hypothetical protein 1 [bacterium]